MGRKPFYPSIVFYSDEDQGYIAKAVDLKGCSAFGETPEQALKELEKTKDILEHVYLAGLIDSRKNDTISCTLDDILKRIQSME